MPDFANMRLARESNEGNLDESIDRTSRDTHVGWQ
jgi:hypothetical protein